MITKTKLNIPVNIITVKELDRGTFPSHSINWLSIEALSFFKCQYLNINNCMQKYL